MTEGDDGGEMEKEETVEMMRMMKMQVDDGF